MEYSQRKLFDKLLYLVDKTYDSVDVKNNLIVFLLQSLFLTTYKRLFTNPLE